MNSRSVVTGSNYYLLCFRNQLKVPAGNSEHSSSSTAGSSGPVLPQDILESLFNMPTPKSAEHEPTTMNWKNVVKKMTSLGQRFGSCPNDIPPLQHTHGTVTISIYSYLDFFRCKHCKWICIF